jgi:hypothetical protein
MSSLYPIYVNYPIVPKPRFGGDQPRHGHLYDSVNRNRLQFETKLADFGQYRKEMSAIRFERDPLQPEEPFWNNDWFRGLDAIALYGILAKTDPKRYFEIGSGFSTKFARRAIDDRGLRTSILSVDPFPRAEIDDICDEIIRKPLEETDIKVFGRLESGDVLFVDSSHYVFQNSDANIVFLEVMPRLKPGVLIHFHDIFLPDDYPATWSHRFYNEQYMLAAYLLGQNPDYEVVFPSYFVTQDQELGKVVQSLGTAVGLQGTAVQGGSFWIRKLR